MNDRSDTCARSTDAARRRALVRDKYNSGRLAGLGPRDIKNVLVINSASRSGSSFLHSLLARHPGVISLNGEEIVFHKLRGIGAINSAADSDLLPPDFYPGASVLEDIARDILMDAGVLYAGGGAFPKENYLADCVQRFALQWPRLQADPDVLYSAAAGALESAARPGEGSDPLLIWLSFLARLSARGVSVNPWYYDIPAELIRNGSPSIKPPEGPPDAAGDCLEEPPFIVPAPRTFPGAGEIHGKTLLLKSSSNCYRSGFIKKLFPAARFRFVLLARNPMAAISGLMDGWLSRGFFSYDVGGIKKLAIKGYSTPEKPWTLNWWKFDLPPGWAGYAEKTLEEVCAFQWLSANEQILKDSGLGVFGEKLAVRYEDLLAPGTLAGEMKKILAFAGLADLDLAAGPAAARPVMAVSAPRAGKWLARERALLPLLQGRVESAAAKLGYDPGEAKRWP